METGNKLLRFRDFLNEEFKDDKFEKQFYNEIGKARIAMEIAYYRERAGLTQAELAKKMKTYQSNIARLENPDYQKYSISLLRRIAEVLDLELVVTFRKKDRKNRGANINRTKHVDNANEKSLTIVEQKIDDHSRLVTEQNKLLREVLSECRQTTYLISTGWKYFSGSKIPQLTITSGSTQTNEAEA